MAFGPIRFAVQSIVRLHVKIILSYLNGNCLVRNLRRRVASCVLTAQVRSLVRRALLSTSGVAAPPPTPQAALTLPPSPSRMAPMRTPYMVSARGVTRPPAVQA